ncbi:MAG: hypothetical protein ACK54H_11775 [Phycisphaerales bacterium]|jgi:hypothetical protein
MAKDASGAVGEGDFVVSSGDCMASIALETGHFWEFLWNHSANRELREVRKDPNVLLAGDRLTVPPIELREESAETEQRHRYRRKGVPSLLELRLMELDEPLANLPYRLMIDGVEVRGTTDRDGVLKHPISPAARQGRLLVGEPGKEREYQLDLGGLDPLGTVCGQKQRLNSMGFEAGPENDEADELFIEAARKFLAENELELKDELDETAQQRLETVYRKRG